MDQEILNIEYHKKLLILKSLNLYRRSQAKAAKALGISEKTLTRRMKEYRIARELDFYYVKEKKLVRIL